MTHHPSHWLKSRASLQQTRRSVPWYIGIRITSRVHGITESGRDVKAAGAKRAGGGGNGIAPAKTATHRAAIHTNMANGYMRTVLWTTRGGEAIGSIGSV